MNSFFHVTGGVGKVEASIALTYVGHKDWKNGIIKLLLMTFIF